ncbi:MAG: FAD-linked oxidase C-terminal domain-containing protein [Rubrimonas sp.]
MSAPLFEGLARSIEGEVLTGAFDRGRYATDASFYQIVPQAVVVPKRFDDVAATLEAARAAGASLTGRGGGTSQAGQTVGPGVVVDFSKHLNGIRHFDVTARRAVVEPGIVLDDLNRKLKPHGLWFPVDVSTASRATIGGMAANNSCCSRSLRYGRMRENVLAIDALLADGTRARFAQTQRSAARANDALGALTSDMLALGAREAEEVAARFPKVQRRVGGYNLDALAPGSDPVNMAHLLVGSEGTLALFESVEIALSPLPGPKALGVCHFPTFRAAMEAAQHLVALGPTAVELVDRTMIALGRDIPVFRPVMEEAVRGDPEALLLVEFGETPEENRRRLDALTQTMADLGYSWGAGGRREGGVVEAVEPAFQARIWDVRTQGLNIMMSMKTEGKPVSFVEDCAVELKDLADFTDRLTALFRRHGTDGTWYAHASVGLLHVRPVLNLKEELGVKALRAIAEEAFDIVAEYKGSHSGEHGDGLVRSEFHEKMFGARLVRAFEQVKDRFDPDAVLNPGKIVRPPKMDDRSLFRWPEGYKAEPRKTAFDWSDWPGGLIGAVEMCNNNGACRKLQGGAMCPSYRATRNERDLTRGRANTLRLALTGQLGPDAFASDEMAETMKLCVSCKACQRECPMSVDMAKMKIEVLAARAEKHGLTLRDRLVGYMPRYAAWATRARWLLNLRNRLPFLAKLAQGPTGFAADRALPEWRAPFVEPADDPDPEIVLLADSFNRHFEPENLRDAVAVLRAAGLRVGFARAPKGRPLCCGRTFLSAGLVGEAKAEMARTAAALRPVLERGGAVVGLEPSCLLTFRDEAPRLLPDWPAELGRRVMLLEEFLAPLADRLPLNPLPRRALLHGHCHQKAANVMGPVERLLRAIPGLDLQVIDSSCCGMAGAFGYQVETAEVSRAMAELSLAPAIRAEPDALVVADGTSCRHQIAETTRREALHVASVLRMSLEAAP